MLDDEVNLRSEALTDAVSQLDIPWYVVHSKPRQEQLARLNLERQGYRTYLPMLKAARRLRGTLTMRLEPLFPRYLFIQPRDAQHSIAPVRSTIGVSKLVRFGTVPALMRAERMRELMQWERQQHESPFEQLTDIQPGRVVAVTEGPFKGLEGIVTKLSEQRVLVLMELLGQEQKIAFDPNFLRLAD